MQAMRWLASNFRFRRCVQLVFVKFLILQLVSHAEEDESNSRNEVNPFVAIEYGNNSNLLGLPNTASAQAIGAGNTLSDTWQKWQAGISLDEKIGLQELLFEADVAKVDFNRLQQLDHDDKNASLDWNWHAGPHLSGQLGFTYENDLTPYIDFHQLALNMRTQSSEYMKLAWMLAPDWRISGGFTNYHLDYQLPAEQSIDRTEGRSTLGVDYLAASGSSVGVQYQHVSAYFPNPELSNGIPIDNNYAQDEAKLKIDWLASAITQVHFLGGWVRRDYDSDTSRDFSGPNWHFTADWLPFSHVTLTGEIWREIDSVDYLTAAYSLNHGIGFGAKWDASDKMKFEGKYQYIRENFGATQSSSLYPTYPFLSENVRILNLMGTYDLTRKLQLRAIFARVIQNQYGPALGFSGNSIALQARYNFGH